MKIGFLVLVGVLGASQARAEEQPSPAQAYPQPAPAPATPPYYPPQPPTYYYPTSPVPPPVPPGGPGASAIDSARTANQWFAVYGFGGVLSKGQAPVGGGIRIARLRWRDTYFTIANLTFAWSLKPNDYAGYFGYFVESGWKFTAGADGQNIFYLGVEAGLGGIGYDIKTSSGHRTNTAMTLHPISPHREYNYHFANHVAFVFELKVIPPIIDGGKAALNGQRNVIVDPPPWLFGLRSGLAF